MNYIITTEDQSIKSIPSGEKYLILNKVLFHHTVVKNNDTIIAIADQGSSKITITPGYTTIENLFNSFKLIDSRFNYTITKYINYVNVQYTFSKTVTMIVNGITTTKNAFSRYNMRITMDYVYVDFKLEEINEAYNNNTKLSTRLAIPINYRYDSAISEIIYKKIRLIDDQINKFNLSMYIDGYKVNNFVSAEFSVVSC